MRESDAESESTKKLVGYCKKWLAHVDNIKNTYQHCRDQVNKSMLKSQHNVGENK